MGESSLSSSYRDFQSEIGFFLGYGIDYTKWDPVEKITIVDGIIQKGLKKFYNPPLLQGQNERHVWSFLNLPGTIQTIVPYSIGTVSSNGVTVTLTTGTWPAWAATNGSLTVDNVSYTISTRVSGNVITLSEAPETDFTDKTFVLSHNGNYDMPDDWNGWKSTFLTFIPNDYEKISFCSEGMIRSLRSNNSSGTPSKAAWRAKSGTTLTSGQRFELMLWPIPDVEYIIEGIYNVFQNKIDPTTYPFPMGGSSHDRTILESILSEAEISINDTVGLHNDLFMSFLAASIKEDEGKEPDFYGYNGEGLKAFNGVVQRKTYVTYEGTLYDGK